MKTLPDIKALLEVFQGSTLPVMEIERDGVRITLTRAVGDGVGAVPFASPRAAAESAGAVPSPGAAENAPGTARHTAAHHPAAHHPAGEPNLAGTHGGAPVCGPTACDFGGHAIVSDRVGRVVTPADKLPAVGATVEAGQTLLVVEALKTSHEIVADGPGTILELNVTTGDVVEWGQPLVTIQ